MSNSKNTINLAQKKVLFYLPITKEFIEQLVVGLTLICHSSERGVVQLLEDLFDYKISVGNVHNILRRAMIRAEELNEQMDLSSVKKGAHDEIFQGSTPILVGSCAETGFCYLLSQEQSRDATTWGTRLLDLKSKGFLPENTIADGALGLRAGQAEALPNIPCYADVFHVLQDLGRLAIYQENRALALIGRIYALEKKMARAKKHNQGNKFSKKLASLRIKLEKNIMIADQLIILNQWMKNDILALAGPNLEIRCSLFDFVTQELEKLEQLGSLHISKVRIRLINQRDDLFRFVDEIDQKLIAITNKFDVDLQTVHSIYRLKAISNCNPDRYSQELVLRDKLRARYYYVEQAIVEALDSVIRSSSIIENLNSRLRNYFFLRKRFGQQSLDLLRFFLNHKVFMRSEHSDHVGKSPAELLYGKPHNHWLELLGYSRFKQVAS